MFYGVDTVSNVTNLVGSLKVHEYFFVARYYSLAGNSKRTSAAEMAAIGNAGLKRISVYQNLHNAYSKFSASIAQGDASDAISQAKACGQMSGAIYFAVDYDASASEIDGNIKAHFQILKNMLRAAGYSLGVYGSSLTCKKLKEAGIVDYTWLAMSTGWGHGTTWSSWNIHQTVPVSLGGIDFDKNEVNSLDGIGAW